MLLHLYSVEYQLNDWIDVFDEMDIELISVCHEENLNTKWNWHLFARLTKPTQVRKLDVVERLKNEIYRRAGKNDYKPLSMDHIYGTH